MMSLQSFETKHLIHKGLQQVKNVNIGFNQKPANPFFYFMSEKNSFSLKGELTPIGVAFYIAPYVNAIVRSGKIDEKNLLFDSMLKFKAFERVPSTKRGSKDGDMERVVDAAIRTAMNVKNRQTKSQNAGMELLEGLIQERNLLDNKVLIFLLESGMISKNIAGLVANKLMAKYQRHTCILFKSINDEGEEIYQGSARAYPKSIRSDFKQLCEDTEVVNYAEGHQGAFGLGIAADNISSFIEITNDILKDDAGEAIYYVDYIYDGHDVDGKNILDISQLNHLWGQDLPEALVAIKNLKVTPDMLTLMSADKNPTIKITLKNTIAVLKFKSSVEEYENLYRENGYVELNLVGTCNSNEWNGKTTPQIFIKDYEIIDSINYYF